MARFTGNNIEQYKSAGDRKTGFFKLADNGDTAKVRLLYSKVDDIEMFTVHRVKVGDYERPVNCLLEDGAPLDDCPFCREKYQKQARLVIPLFNEDVGQFQTWERPQSFYGKIANLVSRYPNIYTQIYEVERRGAKGYQKTDYDFFPIGQPDGTTIDDILDDCELDEFPKALGTVILDKSADDMEYYIKHGEFPSADSDAPVRRRGSEDSDRSERRRGSSRERF